MLTAEENEFFTRVGPGTPMGELLRRYWHPVAVAAELTDENPTRFVRILGEDLVLFRDKSGNAGLIQDHCAHRGASLLYGRVEERGIACAYHGWLYDTAGNCLECPAEPSGSMFHLTVKMRAYPVQKFVGLYWAYLGPLPAPVIPKYDVWTRDDGIRILEVYPRLDCNWLQAMENTMDSAHVWILHQDAGTRVLQPPSTTRGFIDEVERFDYYEVPYGIMKVRVMKRGEVEEQPLIFPNITRQATQTQIRVPIDDTHTTAFFVHFLTDERPSADGADPEAYYVAPFKDPAETPHPAATFKINDFDPWHKPLVQDHMVWETQGAIADRTTERLATSDKGIVLYREILQREVAKVQQGLDPMAVVRDLDHPIIDSNLMQCLARDHAVRKEGRVPQQDLIRQWVDELRAENRHVVTPRR
jgi:5,5'-dehydrodivanillate O-demethylase